MEAIPLWEDVNEASLNKAIGRLRYVRYIREYGMEHPPKQCSVSAIRTLGRTKCCVARS